MKNRMTKAMAAEVKQAVMHLRNFGLSNASIHRRLAAIIPSLGQASVTHFAADLAAAGAIQQRRLGRTRSAEDKAKRLRVINRRLAGDSIYKLVAETGWQRDTVLRLLRTNKIKRGENWLYRNVI